MKNLNYWIVAILALSIPFTSCSKDNENDDSISANYATTVSGTYKGYTKAVAQYFPSGQFSSDQNIKVEANEDKTVNVTYTSTSFGIFTINNATVKFENNTYTINGKGKTLMGMQGSDLKEYACEFSATIDKDKEAPSFEFKVPPVMGGLKITFTTGNVPEAQFVSGTYKGYTKAVAQYFTNGQYANDQSIKVEANEDKTVKVSYTSTSFGTFTIKNATVKFENDTYTINGEGKTLMGMQGGDPKEYACEFNATIDKNKTTPSFEFKIPAVMGGLAITHMPGTAPEAK